MFTRVELEIKTTAELRDLCRRYGLKPTGNGGYKTSWIVT
ncbi:MAG: SAP domain-containing protein [Nostoc sp.]